MTSLRSGLRIAGASVAAMLALAGCDPDDGNSETGNNGPTTTMQSADTESAETTGDESEPPADGSDEGSDDGDDSSSADVTHDADIQPIWTESCATASCHDGTFVPNLTEGMAYGEIVGVMSDTVDDINYIEANDPEMSYLYLKLIDSQGDVGGGGVQMPLTGMLSDDDIELVESWINAGAPE